MSKMRLTPEEEQYRKKVLADINGIATAYLNLSELDYQRLMDKVEAETVDRLVQARQAGRSPFDMEQDRVDAANREIALQREIELNGYHLGFNDFKRFSGTLGAVSLMPDLEGSTLCGVRILEALYMASSPDHRVAREGADALIGVCDNLAVGGFVRALRRNYEVLQRSLMLGNRDVHVIGQRHVCASCSKLNGTYLPVDGLLRLYDLNVAPFPHEVPSRDGAVWCPGPMLSFATNDLFGLRGK